MTVPTRLVPDDFRGVWQRTLLQTDTEAADPPACDSTSWVRWLQTSQWYGDLRVPQSAMYRRVVQPLEALSHAQLLALSGQQGFVGIAQYEALPEGPLCTWLRRVDYQPPGLQPDAGWLICDQPHHLIEIGVHEDFNEIWERLPDSMGRYIALAGSDELERDDGRRLLIAGSYMMLARPRHVRWPRGLTPGCLLADVMASQPDQTHDWLDCEISFGRLQPQGWVIERSTLPGREGLCSPFALEREDERFASLVMGEQSGRWHVLEWSHDANRFTA